MFSYKLTIKNRKSRKAKLEKFYDALVKRNDFFPG